MTEIESFHHLTQQTTDDSIQASVAWLPITAEFLPWSCARKGRKMGAVSCSQEADLVERCFAVPQGLNAHLLLGEEEASCH